MPGQLHCLQPTTLETVLSQADLLDLQVRTTTHFSCLWGKDGDNISKDGAVPTATVHQIDVDGIFPGLTLASHF